MLAGYAGIWKRNDLRGGALAGRWDGLAPLADAAGPAGGAETGRSSDAEFNTKANCIDRELWKLHAYSNIRGPDGEDLLVSSGVDRIMRCAVRRPDGMPAMNCRRFGQTAWPSQDNVRSLSYCDIPGDAQVQ